MRQAAGPVRWVEVVQQLQVLGARTVIECGPGKVLSGMVKRISPEINAANVLDPATLVEAKGLVA